MRGPPSVGRSGSERRVCPASSSLPSPLSACRWQHLIVDLGYSSATLRRLINERVGWGTCEEVMPVLSQVQCSCGVGGMMCEESLSVIVCSFYCTISGCRSSAFPPQPMFSSSGETAGILSRMEQDFPILKE